MTPHPLTDSEMLYVMVQNGSFPPPHLFHPASCVEKKILGLFHHAHHFILHLRSTILRTIVEQRVPASFSRMPGGSIQCSDEGFALLVNKRSLFDELLSFW